MNRGRHKKSDKNGFIDVVLAKYGYKITKDVKVVRTILLAASSYIKKDQESYGVRISTEWAIITYIKNPYGAFYFYNTKEGADVWKTYTYMINNSIKSIKQSNSNRI